MYDLQKALSILRENRPFRFRMYDLRQFPDLLDPQTCYDFTAMCWSSCVPQEEVTKIIKKWKTRVRRTRVDCRSPLFHKMFYDASRANAKAAIPLRKSLAMNDLNDYGLPEAWEDASYAGQVSWLIKYLEERQSLLDELFKNKPVTLTFVSAKQIADHNQASFTEDLVGAIGVPRPEPNFSFGIVKNNVDAFISLVKGETPREKLNNLINADCMSDKILTDFSSMCFRQYYFYPDIEHQVKYALLTRTIQQIALETSYKASRGNAENLNDSKTCESNTRVLLYWMVTRLLVSFNPGSSENEVI